MKHDNLTNHQDTVRLMYLFRILIESNLQTSSCNEKVGLRRHLRANWKSEVNGVGESWLVSEGNDISKRRRQSQAACCAGHMETFRLQAFVKINPSYEWISVWERTVCVGSGCEVTGEGGGSGWWVGGRCSSLLSFHSRHRARLNSSQLPWWATLAASA